MSFPPARSHVVSATGTRGRGHRPSRAALAAIAAAWTLGLAAAPLPLPAQRPGSTPDRSSTAGARRIAGVLRDARSGGGVVGEIVAGARPPLRSDSLGHFELEGLPRGTCTLHVRAIGYRPVVREIAEAGGDVTTIEVLLEPVLPRLALVATVTQREERARFDGAPQAGMLSFTRNDLAHVPAVGDRDVLRVAALLPGIASRNDFSSAFNVRGGEADQNLVLLDGVPIYNPFHLGGVFGTFIDATVARVDLMTGGFPATYGGRLSSVLDVQSAVEERPGVHGTTDVSVLSSSARLAGAIGGGRATWSVAARRTYADKVVEALHGANDFPYHFRDAHGRATLALPRGGRVAATLYSGLDVMADASGAGRDSTLLDEVRDVTFDWGNRVAGVEWSQPLGASFTTVQRLSRSAFHTAFAVPSESLAIAQHMGDTRASIRLVRQGAAHDASAGVEWSSIASRYRERVQVGGDSPFPDATPSTGDTSIVQRGGIASIFLEDSWRVAPRLTLRTGARADAVRGIGWGGISPRVTARWSVTRDMALTASAGRYTQWTHAVRNEDLPLRLFDLWLLSGADVPLSRATHVVVGAERWLSRTRFVRLEGYGKRFSDLSEPASSIDPRIRPSLLRRYDGLSYGADAMLRQLAYKGVSGWLSYSYAWSARGRDSVRYFAAHDRRHSANLVVSWEPDGGRRWSYGLRASASSGTPYTGWAGRMTRWTYDPLTHRWGPAPVSNDDDIVHASRNGARLPAYARLDLSAERAFVTGWGKVTPSLSVVNVLDRRNVLLYALAQQRGTLRIVRHQQFPLLPSLGLRVEF